MKYFGGIECTIRFSPHTLAIRMRFPSAVLVSNVPLLCSLHRLHHPDLQTATFGTPQELRHNLNTACAAPLKYLGAAQCSRTSQQHFEKNIFFPIQFSLLLQTLSPIFIKKKKKKALYQNLITSTT